MTKSEIENLLFHIAKELNLAQESIVITSSMLKRKKCYKELEKPYFPLVPNTVCEAVPSFDYKKFYILVYPENVSDENILKEEFIKVSKETLSVAKRLNIDNQNGKTLLRIISNYLNGKNEDFSQINPQVYELAKRHEVSGIAYKVTGNERLKAFYFDAVKKYAIRTNLIKKIKAEFEKENIEHYFVKGSVVCKYYPTPELRTMGDIDIHVHWEDKNKAADVMTKLGFTFVNIGGTGEWKCVKDGYYVELHHSLCYEATNAEKEERNIMLDEWDYVENNELNREFHFIYLLTHLRKHLTNCGVGFRQFLDLAVEIKFAELDFNKILELAKTAGLEKFLLVVFALIEEWFSVSVPYKTDLTEEFIQSATFRVLNNGVFGYQKVKDENKNYARFIKRNGILKIFITSIFLPYQSFLMIDGYEWLKGKPFLLPIAWVVRIFKSAIRRNKRNESVYILNRVAAVRNTNTEFSEWGL